MIEFIEQISDLLASVLGFIITGIMMLVQVFVTMFQALGYILLAITALPAFVSGVVIVSISVAVVLFIINKGAS